MTALYELAGKIAGPDLRLTEARARSCYLQAVSEGEVEAWREARFEVADGILDAALDRAYGTLATEIDSGNFAGEFLVRGSSGS